MTAYATGEDLADRYDIRLIGKYCQDDNAQLSRADIVDHRNVAQALEDGSGEVEAALLTAGRYSVDQLTSLTGNAQAHLQRITCAVAMACLVRRRLNPDMDDMAQQLIEDANRKLTDLRKGSNVFGLDEITEAGQMKTEYPTVHIIRNRNLLPERMNGMIPGRETTLPLDKGGG